MPTSVTFVTVKALLDDMIAAWRLKHGREPDLAGKHRFGQFGWADREQLLRSRALNLPLIDRRLVGNGNANKTYLIETLTKGVNGLPRMPLGGPYLSRDQISTIAQWIDDGCPDESGQPWHAHSEDIEQIRWMIMRDPEVQVQSDLDPYPDGPGKIVLVWQVGMRFNSAVDSPVQIKVKGFDSLGPGNAFDQILQDDVYQDIGRVYSETDIEGRLLLDSSFYGPSTSPFFNPNGNEFPDPTTFYDFRRLRNNGRAFLVHWRIWHHETYPVLDFTAEQLAH